MECWPLGHGDEDGLTVWVGVALDEAVLEPDTEADKEGVGEPEAEAESVNEGVSDAVSELDEVGERVVKGLWVWLAVADGVADSEPVKEADEVTVALADEVTDSEEVRDADVVADADTLAVPEAVEDEVALTDAVSLAVWLTLAETLNDTDSLTVGDSEVAFANTHMPSTISSPSVHAANGKSHPSPTRTMFNGHNVLSWTHAAATDHTRAPSNTNQACIPHNTTPLTVRLIIVVAHRAAHTNWSAHT
jgi:hypothetical protein